MPTTESSVLGDEIQEVEAAVRSVLGEGQQATEWSGVFAERLLTLRHAEALPEGIREVRLAPGTVVTPLAFDFLKRRGIGLRFVARGAITDHAEWGFAVEVESGVVAAWRRSLLDEDWKEFDSCLNLRNWISHTSQRGGLLLTVEASVAVWRACQGAGIRAAAAETCDAVDRAVRRLGVNLLVVEPSGKSISLLKQLALTLRRGGTPRVPEGLEWEGSPCGSPK